jgi:hypothetical protein
MMNGGENSRKMLESVKMKTWKLIISKLS